MSTATEAEEESAWEQVLRKMLPAGAPLPDEDHLDYSIAVEYQGPPVPYQVPRVDPLNLDSLSIRSSSLVSVADDTDVSVPVAAPITASKISKFSRFRNGTANVLVKESTSSVPQIEKAVNGENEEEGESAQVVNGRKGEENEGKRVNVVKFNTPRDSETEDDGYSSTQSSAAADALRPTSAVRKGSRKRGVCSRCGKKNRLKEREACLVCDARYCSNCMLKAMGSMPEGRKCVSCIGHPIDELKRSSLGKCSRILSKVCSPLEVRQIMRAEKECAANQLRPEQLIVNGRSLRQEELAEVLGCPIPPQNLKPGKYWYDKDSGLWGKVISFFLKKAKNILSQ